MSAVRPVLVPPSATRPPPGRVDEALSLLAHAAAPLQSDHIRVLLRVLFTGGTPPTTSDRAAAEAGCSPSTARTLVNRAREIARRAGPPASLLAADRLLGEEIRSGADAALAMYRAGLTAGVLHPGTVLLAMDWFGCVPSAAVCWLPDCTSLTVPLRQRERVLRAPGQMRGWCLAQGISTVSALAERAGISDEVAMRLLDADPRFGRLATHVWAVPDTGRNLVRHAVRRQLAVRPHTVADLHAGIRAALRVRPGRRPPPLEALHAYLEDQPAYGVDDRTARATPGVDAPLAASDAVIVEAFHAASAKGCPCPSCGRRSRAPDSVSRGHATSCAAPRSSGAQDSLTADARRSIPHLTGTVPFPGVAEADTFVGFASVFAVAPPAPVHNPAYRDRYGLPATL